MVLLKWITIQPSEYLKPFFVVFVSWVVAGNIDRNPRAALILSFFSMCMCVFIDLATRPWSNRGFGGVLGFDPFCS